MMMQHLLPLAALLLMSIIPTETKVVSSIEQCNEFFFNEKPPHIPTLLEEGTIMDQTRYKVICQTFRDRKCFVTLYDIHNKIPLFSAAKYKGGDNGGRPKAKWMIEPQLENINDKNDNMIGAKKKICNSQAQGTDYCNSAYKRCNRGHLFPSSYGSSPEEKRSTFTLTNVVPQNEDFNSGSWNNMEKCVKCILDKYCNNKEGFVVIGAQPSSSNLLKEKINIPSKLWSAFCCESDSEKKWLAGAYWGNNKAGITMDLKPLKELHGEMGHNFEVFPGGHCPLDAATTHLYSELPPDCSCPRPKKQ